MLRDKLRVFVSRISSPLHNICIDHGDLYDCSDSNSDDSDSEDDYAGPLQKGGTEIREALKNFCVG